MRDIRTVEGLKNYLENNAVAVGHYSFFNYRFEYEQTKTENKLLYNVLKTSLFPVIREFHSKETFAVQSDRVEYVGRIRSGTYIVEIGHTDFETGNGKQISMIFVTGNHKGIRMTEIYLPTIYLGDRDPDSEDIKDCSQDHFLFAEYQAYLEKSVEKYEELEEENIEEDIEEEKDKLRMEMEMVYYKLLSLNVSGNLDEELDDKLHKHLWGI